MSLKDKVRFLPRHTKSDERGWLLKLITGYEENLPKETGEMYIVYTQPGHVRGNHYHGVTSEWFSVFQGYADVILEDVETKERMTFRLSEENYTTVYVPFGIAHAFIVPSDAPKPMLLAAYADKPFVPAENIPYKLK
jgi:dTDP-4-dehydrorhamnose 3,5-epimerase-like enzyme